MVISMPHYSVNCLFLHSVDIQCLIVEIGLDIFTNYIRPVCFSCSAGTRHQIFYFNTQIGSKSPLQRKEFKWAFFFFLPYVSYYPVWVWGPSGRRHAVGMLDIAENVISIIIYQLWAKLAYRQATLHVSQFLVPFLNKSKTSVKQV